MKPVQKQRKRHAPFTPWTAPPTPLGAEPGPMLAKSQVNQRSHLFTEQTRAHVGRDGSWPTPRMSTGVIISSSGRLSGAVSSLTSSCVISSPGADPPITATSVTYTAPILALPGQHASTLGRISAPGTHVGQPRGNLWTTLELAGFTEGAFPGGLSGCTTSHNTQFAAEQETFDIQALRIFCAHI